MPFHEVIGIVGVLQILLAYALLQLDRITTRQLVYQLLNAFGAALILYSLFHEFNRSAFIIESCWLLISLYGIFRNLMACNAGDSKSTS